MRSIRNWPLSIVPDSVSASTRRRQGPLAWNGVTARIPVIASQRAQCGPATRVRRLIPPEPVSTRYVQFRLESTRFFSATEVDNGKPAPDLFLHAAASLGVPAGRCAVVWVTTSTSWSSGR